LHCDARDTPFPKQCNTILVIPPPPRPSVAIFSPRLFGYRKSGDSQYEIRPVWERGCRGRAPLSIGCVSTLPSAARQPQQTSLCRVQKGRWRWGRTTRGGCIHVPKQGTAIEAADQGGSSPKGPPCTKRSSVSGAR